MRQLALDLSDSRLASFVDAVSAALEDTGKYPWLEDHPIRYPETGDGAAIVRSDAGGCWAPVSFMQPHQVLWAIADAVERRADG